MCLIIERIEVRGSHKIEQSLKESYTYMMITILTRIVTICDSELWFYQE